MGDEQQYDRAVGEYARAHEEHGTSGVPEAYPAHAKLAKVRGDAQAVGEFLEWAGEQGIMLGQHQRVEGYRDPQFVPLAEQRDAVLARFFDIDLAAIEREKRAMLAAIRAARGED